MKASISTHQEANPLCFSNMSNAYFYSVCLVLSKFHLSSMIMLDNFPVENN